MAKAKRIIAKIWDFRTRLTGISNAFAGASWKPAASVFDTAREVIVFLESKRVLFVPSEMELPKRCVESVINVRDYLTAAIQKLNEKEPLTKNLRAMRIACNKFLQSMTQEVIDNGNKSGHYASWIFAGALGEMRGVFGIHIAIISETYDVQINADEEGLYSILPGVDEENIMDYGIPSSQ
jgi:hypothetical protein